MSSRCPSSRPVQLLLLLTATASIARTPSPDMAATPASAPVPVPASVPVPIPAPEKSTLSNLLAPLYHNPISAALYDVTTAFQERRNALGLPYPGSVDGISREVTRDVFLNSSMFGGFRADFTKSFSAAPLFQTAHNFTMGAQGMPAYSFAGLYGSPQVRFSHFRGRIEIKHSPYLGIPPRKHRS